jgi:spermidine synthase
VEEDPRIERSTVTPGTIRPGPVYLTVLVIATCGLIYELVAATLASYLLGDSVTQFSLVIGVYLTSMGLGAWLSKFLERGLPRRFIEAELAVALIGGLSAPALSFAFSSSRIFQPVFFGVVTVVGMLVGLEIPLMLRILKSSVEFKDLVAQVLTFDYLGALFASVLFPIFFIPRLGLFRTCIFFGLLNVAVAFASIHLFRERLGNTGFLYAKGAVVTAFLLAAFASSEKLTSMAEEGQFADEVVFARNSHYQRIVMTRNKAGFQLFLNGHLQFSSVDEYRYHEALVHPAFGLHPGARNIAVLGGGDGLAVREILKYPDVESITLVDLDPEMTNLAKNHSLIRSLNQDSMHSPKVTVVNTDAMKWLQAGEPRLFDIVFIDFPDPNSYSVGKLYTSGFYRLLKRRLDPDGVFAVQSTSPLFARQSYWIIERSIAAAGFSTLPYHVAVPSFGEWGFVLASHRSIAAPSTVRAGLRFLSNENLPSIFQFGPDVARVDVPVNRLNDQVLVHIYEKEWRKFD